MWIYLCLLMCSLSGVYSFPQKNSEQMPDRKEILKSVDKLLKSPDRYHKVATLSLLTGALQAERKMEFALNKLAEDFYDNFNKSSLQENEKKLKEISKFVQRDLRSMFILNNALDVASKNFSKSEFDKAIKDMTIRNERHAPKIGPNILKESHNPVESVKKFLSNHVNSIRTKLFNKVKHTVDHLNGAKEKVKDKISSHKKSKKSKDNSLPVESIKHEQDLFPAYLPNDPFSSFDTDPYLFAPYQENPEDEDLPPRPDIFVKKLIEGFGDGLRRDGAADVEEASTPGKPDGSAGFFGFITRIVKAVVGGVTSFILNASLGSSGGASQGAAELSSGASGASSSGSDSSTHDKY